MKKKRAYDLSKSLPRTFRFAKPVTHETQHENP